MTMVDVIRHYDLLIDEGNDPVHDPMELRAYMDKWDGAAFQRALALDGSQSVLEIGVGTGRLAMRIAPECRSYTGIDVSPKTIVRAKENLAQLSNVALVCCDFLAGEINASFDVICSTLTFMHIADKVTAVRRIAALLTPGGRVVISLDKNQAEYIDYGLRCVRVYPDDPKQMEALMQAAGLTVLPGIETEYAHIIVAERR
jgi:ubiquinone/menaquinone biosynthesis C-methylase UbiE